MNLIIKKESETTDLGIKKQYDIFEKTRYDRTFPKMHTHSFYEIILINEGELSLQIELDGYAKLSKGDIIFIPPYVPHATYREKNGKMRCTVVKFSPSFLFPAELTQSDVICLIANPSFSMPYFVFKNNSDYDFEISGTLLRALALITDKPLGYETALRGELSCLYVRLLGLCENDLYVNIEDGIDLKSSENMKRVLKYVKENYMYPISMEQLASECNMSYCSFSRFFKQTMKKSFSEYLLDTRLSQAQKAILSGNASISDIAADCGFEYVSYFIRRFKKKYGVTPLEYRKLYV